MAWVLCTKEDVREFVSIPETALKDSWSDITEGLIRTRLGLEYLGIEGAPIVGEVRDGDGTSIIKPKNLPLASVQEIRVNGAAIPESAYVIDPTLIRLKYTCTPKCVGCLSLDYTPGTLEVPENVKLTAIMMIIGCSQYFGRQGADASLKWSALTGNDIGDSSTQHKMGLVPYLKQIMDETLQIHRLRIG